MTTRIACPQPHACNAWSHDVGSQAQIDCQRRSASRGERSQSLAGALGRITSASITEPDKSIKPTLPDAPPPGVGTPVGSPGCRDIAQEGLAMITRAGSEVYGLNIDTGDHDEAGICFEAAAYVTGLKKTDRGQPFEQFEHRSAWLAAGDKEKTSHMRSTGDDYDLTIYSARKFAAMAKSGNPNALLLLFGPDDQVRYETEAISEMRANADRFVSKKSAGRYLGFINNQRQLLQGGKVKRPELMDSLGWDTKAGYMATRMGVQGVELMSTGTLTIPVTDPDRSRILAIRRGEVTLGQTLEWVDELEAQLVDLKETSHLPDEPDGDWIDEWLHRSYLQQWGLS